MNLKDWLRQREGTSGVRGEWPRSLDGIHAAAEMIWERPLHRYYTDHSVNHSERVIEKLSKLAKDLMDSSISSTEVYVLLASAYLHDIGMQDERFKGCDLDQIRIHHHELTRKIITNRSFDQSSERIPLGLELVPAEIVHTIACVAEAHRQTNLRENRYREFVCGDQKIRPRLLAALLRLADELDIDCRRVHMQQLSLMDISAESEFHWCLCYYVSGVQIQNGLITVYYQFPEECNNYRKIIEPFVTGKIEEEFPALQRILWEGGCKVTMNDRCEVRAIPGLRCMSSDVLEFALRKRKEMATKKIDYQREDIKYYDSMTKAVFMTQVENSDE